MKRKINTYVLTLSAIFLLLALGWVVTNTIRYNTQLLNEIATTQLKLSTYTTRLNKNIQLNQEKTIEALILNDESALQTIKQSGNEIIETIRQLSACVHKHATMLPPEVPKIIDTINKRVIAFEKIEKSILDALKHNKKEEFQDALIGFNATAAAFSADVLHLVELTNALLQKKISTLQKSNEKANLFISITFVLTAFLLLTSLYFTLRYQKKMLRQLNRAENAEKQTRLLSRRLEHYSKELEVEIEKKKSELTEKIYTNAISKLPNRNKLLEDIQNNTFKYLALLNIDNFQKFNDVYGEAFGNIALKASAEFLQNNTPKNYNIYHIGGDEFVISALKQSDLESDDFVAFIQNILKAFRKKEFIIDSKRFVLTMTAGISLGGMQKMLAYADMALKDAKKKGKAYEIYEGKSLEASHKEDLECYHKLLDALQNRRLVAFLQPIVPISDPALPCKYESLVRIIDENSKIIPPVNFLRVAKQNRINYKITKEMFYNTLKLIKEYKVPISINLSMADITNEKTVDMIYKELAAFHDAHLITFELLETEDFKDYASVYDFCMQVKSYGVSLALDDFGSGYSNFSHILHLPIDFIKIDASLISNISRDHASRLMVEIIVLLAKKIGAKTIAEFVSSEEIYNIVKELGVDYAQGFYVGKPERPALYLNNSSASPC